MGRIKEILIVISILAILCVASFYVGKKKGIDSVVVRERVDTICTIDTCYIEKPVPYLVYREKRDSIYIPITDTIRMQDTLYLVASKEVKQYKDSTYNLQISGYECELDWIETYSRTVGVTNTIVVEKPYTYRWGVAVSAGYGACVNNGNIRLSPTLSVGISYNILYLDKRRNKK